MIIDTQDLVIKNNGFNSEHSELIFDNELDFESYSLIEIAMAVESELTGIDVKKIESELKLQHIVIESKLSDFPIADNDKLNGLIDIIYHQQGFVGDWESFFKIDNALISKVVSSRKGIPITMGIVLLEILEKCGFSVSGICFPSGFMIRIDLPDEVVYLDPFTGELPTWKSLELMIRGQLGNHARLTLDMLKPDSNKTIIKRLINVIKAAYLQANVLEMGLLCSDILLRIDPDDAYEVRDRGFMFQQLDCFKLASSDFEFFIQKFPEDPIVTLLEQQIKKMNLDKDSQVIH